MGIDRTAFWRHYLRAAGYERSNLDPADAVCVDLLVEPGTGLRVDVSQFASNCYLIHPDLKSPRLLGWDDDAHFHPHVFRWDEVVLLNQAVASSPEGFPAVLLLIPFTAAPSSELTPTAVSIVMSGLHATGVFPETGLEATARDLLSYYMRVPVTWQENTELGPVPIEQPSPLVGSLYTLRAPTNPEFPFAELSSLFAGALRRMNT